MQEPSRNTQKFILKFFPEIMIKGTAAKRQMIGQLYANLVRMAERIHPGIGVRKFFDKIEVVAPLEVLTETRLMLLRTPGIEQVLEVLQFDGMETIDAIKHKVGEVVTDTLRGKTFVVRVKRSGTHPFRSTDVEQTVGGHLRAHSEAKGVDLRNPEITVRLELVDKQLNIITDRYRGLGGYPIGTQGEILSLMSGGFDSTVASYLSMRRGIKTHFVFFNLGGAAHEIGVKQVALYLWSRYGSSHRVSFVSVPFDGVVAEIFRSTAPTYMGVTLKRLMLMASEKIADAMEIDALMTGESVAQVSSQTLRNLAIIDQATTKLVLRPLSTMDKPDIIAIADEIGTRHFAENMPEYCGVISQNPVTHGSFKRMEKEAKKFDYAVLDKAVEEAQHINVDEIVEDVGNFAPVEVVSDLSSGEYTIIDIRPGSECIEAPCECIKIPFHKLKTEFGKLPQEKAYLLYCDKGVMSQLHAQYLRDAKKSATVRVYRPA